MVLDARELLTANLSLIERLVTFACRRFRLQQEDAEEVASLVNLKLVENDYAILRSYKGLSTLSSFLSVVIQNVVLDYRNHVWGKWHSSAEARRLGRVAVDLEELLHRDGRIFEEAVTILASRYEGVTPDTLRDLAARLPKRPARRRDVPIEDAAPVPDEDNDTESRAMEADRKRTATRVEQLLAAAFEQMPEDEQVIFQLKFEQGMTVAQIARALGRDQKLLYRQIEVRMRQIRAAIEQSGIATEDVLDLIGNDEAFFSFDFGKHEPRPSIKGDETETAQPEEPE